MIGRRNLKPWFDEARADDNPYLTEWFAAAVAAERLFNLFSHDQARWQAELTRSLQEGTHEMLLRRQLVGKYAWAVPCRAALDVLTRFAPLVEIGCGTGYWAWLLRRRGVEVAAFDAFPPPSSDNHWHAKQESWIKVERGDASVLKDFRQHTLFLCWPPYGDAMAAECLRHYPGNRLVFVGEGQGGCTGGDDFWEALNRDWKEVADVTLPQFDGIRDYLSVWEK